MITFGQPANSFQADLPFKQRQKWVNNQATSEFKRECRVVWEMFKKDPLSPFNAYCRRYVITGMGMFTEGYTICEYQTRSCASGARRRNLNHPRCPRGRALACNRPQWHTVAIRAGS